MPWFRVDDSFYDHPKVFDAPDCAMALWVRAGCWSARNLTDGFVPANLPARLCDDHDTAVRELVRRGLWSRAAGGYQFHDWEQCQMTASEVRERREKRAQAGRMGGLAKARAAQQAASKELASASPVAKQNAAPTRPDPVLKDSSTRSPEKKNSSRSRADEPTRVDVEQICRHLAEQIVANGSKRPTITAEWRRQARLLLDEERAEPTSVRQVVNLIDWCQRDPFWRANIQSMPTFRKQYDQLRLKALAEAKRDQGQAPGVRHVDDKSAEQRREQNPFRGMVRGSDVARESS